MAINPELGIKLIYILGITNILSIILVMFTCRCMGLYRLTNKLFQYPWFQKIYSKHCWYWYIFIISVFAHTILAFKILGNPF
tara:strand:- start:42 stop:287 length:246 start_codon:yes stop_codon:yes gene_type:complete